MRLKIEVFVVLCLLGLALQYAIRLNHAERERDQAQQTADSLFMEDAGNKAALNGWAVKFGTLQKDMNKEFAKRDTMAAALVKDLNKAHARIRSLVEVIVSLNDSITSIGTPGDTTAAGEVSYHGAINDGLLDASWGFLAPELSLAYRVTLGLEIVSSEGGGRFLVTARAKDPRVSLSIPAFYFDPPAPTSKCTFGAKAKWLLIGGLTGAGVRSIY